MIYDSSFKALLFFLIVVFPCIGQGQSMKNEIHHYMSFTYPMDPAAFVSHGDMKIAYAVASTLVEWSPSKQVIGGLASRYEKIGEKIVFRLRSDLKWSDGSPLTSADVKRSFIRAFEKNPGALRSLKNVLDQIETPDNRTVVFQFSSPIDGSDLLKKLTEPNYGVTKVTRENEVDLSASSGAYFVEKYTKEEVVLVRNPYWYRTHPKMPERIVARLPDTRKDETRFILEDSWVNLMETTSILSEEVLSTYETRGCSIWRRPNDKVYVLLPGKRSGEERFQVLRYLRKVLDRSKVVKGFSKDGLELTTQLFPRGYELHDPDFQCPEIEEDFALDATKIFDLLVPVYGAGPGIKENVLSAIEAATKGKGNLLQIKKGEYFAQKKKGDFDINGTSYGLADPHSEGVMSAYLEGDYPLIQSGKGKYNYIRRLDEAREEKDYSKRIKLFRGILKDAVCDGRVLPIFHFSTVGIARKGVDLSGLPETDEAVTFSRIRFN